MRIARILNTFLHIIYRIALLLIFLSFYSTLKAGNIENIPLKSDTVPQPPPPVKKSNITRYLNIITDQQQRDSFLSKLTRTDEPPPVSDSMTFKTRENALDVYRGKFIRYIYFNQLKVFGTTIEDTTVIASRLVRFANRLHYNTRTWIIEQALFFSEGDTVNAYKLVDNERFLRRLPYIQDARIYVINSHSYNDSVDIVVVTKDLFEYGGSISQFNNTQASATIFNNNLFGVGQKLAFGFSWDNGYDPHWRTGASYTKYNMGGSFADVSIGYTMLNDKPNVDTGQYENSGYLIINRPLYSTWASFTGGLTLSLNRSVNIFNKPDSLFYNYKYSVVDAWAGYNFTNQYKKTGFNSRKPNIGIELRSFNLNFSQNPEQTYLDTVPNYNSHNFLLSQLVFYHQDFFKTNYFFGFGRTEDIPLGYTYAASFGVDRWMGLIRSYTAIQAQKYWLPGKNLISTTVGFGTYWNSHQSQDAVLHVQTDYYSNIWPIRGPKIREFLHADYLICFNPVIYKSMPLNINKENGIFGYRYTLYNGYQRLNLGAQTNYYSPISIYGFKFNFYLLMQASLLASENASLFTSPFYSGFTLGCQIRNENLSFNTFQISASYLPQIGRGPEAANGPNGFFVYISSVTAFSFPIFALTQPTLIQYR